MLLSMENSVLTNSDSAIELDYTIYLSKTNKRQTPKNSLKEGKDVVKPVIVILVQFLFLGFATVSVVQASSQQESELVSSGTADLKLLSDKYVNGEFGDQIVGEVINNGTVSAGHVKLTLSLFGGSHISSGTDYVVTQPSNILPSERASFVISIPEDFVQQPPHYDIVADWVNPDGTTEHDTLGSAEKTQRPTTIPQDEKLFNDTTASPPISELSTALLSTALPSGSTNSMNNASQVEQVLETSGSNDSQNNNLILLVETTQGTTGGPAWDGWIQVSDSASYYQGNNMD
jgi:hypothetical protein